MVLLDALLTDWSRAQFALTAIYHWFFVPLTLGLSFIMAITETFYVKTGNEEWKKITKFWMTLFGINFAIGVATGIILEFEFGTNWSKYSWIVGDIFGAPLAIEGIFAFFLESTFVAVMFFGWEKMSKKFHLLSTWLVAFGSNLSAYWILVANAWMNNPVGTVFNPDTARNEMVSFAEVAFSPFAINKFLHTISSGYVISALFVLGVSSWYLLKNRHIILAKKSIIVASIFGLISTFFIILTGDGSAYQVAQKQPMKFAVMEGLYEGKKGADLVVFGILNPSKTINDTSDAFIGKIAIPKFMSLLAYRDANAFVPGIKDILYGNDKYGIEPAENKVERGKTSLSALKMYKEAKKMGDTLTAQSALEDFKKNYPDFGYAHFTSVEQLVPNIPLVFYSFHIMVGLGFLFLVIFVLALWYSLKDKLSDKKWLLRIAVLSIPLGYIASQLGWVVAEVGRQPWAIQDVLHVFKATSHLSVGNVQTTFFLLLVLLTVLFIAEIRILINQIKKGPKEL
jgi:cytochrome d ubiquinol oxidase subunit I